jgi:membrane fusion protein (multidrug efflux system)
MARSSMAGAQANLENQRANLTKARAVAANDGRQAERMKALFDRGLVSATEWENARTVAESSGASVQSAEAQLVVSQTQVATADSQVRLADAQLETQRASLQLAQASLANTRLTAPFAGVLTQRNLDAGAVVSAGSSGTNTSSVGILVIQDIQTVKVQVEIPERAVDRVIAGQTVRITVDALKGTPFSGTVARVVHTLDPRSRTMGVEVEIPNRDGRLKPGMFARVELVLDTRKQALVVPGEALRLGEGRPAVMVVREGVAQSVPVETGVVDGPWIEVRSGVTEKDKVIVQGKDLVKSGQKVRATPATAAGS